MINNSGIWDVEEAKKGHFHSLELARKLERVFTKRMPVLDLGCGLGFYAHHLSSKGFSVTAYEGTEGIHEISIFKQIITHDLTEPLPDSIKGQVLCMEVGEHIPKANEQQFIDNITAVCEGRLVISWAVPGQGGRGHVNEQPNKYIIQQLEKRGFALNETLTQELRNHNDNCWRFKVSIFVFDKL